MNFPTNRITDLLDESSPTLAPRTPAQQEASRKNGALSRGPVTEEGKSRSRLNAVKHGILSRLLAPPADYRRGDLDYLQIRRQLVVQFKPTLFTKWALVDGLAADYLELARCRRMGEALARPAPLPPEDANRIKNFDRYMRLQPLLGRLRKSLDAGWLAQFPMFAAVLVANQIVLRVETLINDLAEDDAAAAASPSPEASSPSPPLSPGNARIEAADAESLKKDRELLKRLGASVNKFLDHSHICAVLRGDVQMGRQDLMRLHTLAVGLHDGVQVWLQNHRDLEEMAQETAADALALLGKNPEGLILLQKYQTRIERAIEKKLRELME